ncbi:PAAR-like domain-containing protein [Polyangium sp. 6x1]|uniref:PAAR-like domain-containing protein n=1 Tax=Polyangium sp. 6x1 TaxID=3042689 RepID=UPI002482DB88|nr:PAAR-like domain-containing protein [Polyangium sp. 6x1]MDI1446892.1 DUF4150 domain-containing protein [Polyangium sp. 6x1]
MGATVTNEDLGVTTKTSDHTAATVGPTDVCFNPPKTVAVPHPNYVTTDKAVEHTSGKTLFQNGNVVRVGEAITPSDPAHGDSGGGVASGTYREEARATRGSPNVRAEGKAPARTDDPTTQNHANTTGKIFQNVPPGLLEDNPEEFFKRCSYDTSKIKCEHQEFVEMPQIDVKRGDTITIEAKRKNAKVPDAPPDCAQPPHMKWRVTRSGGQTALGAAIPPKEEEFTGDTLTVADWLPELATLPDTEVTVDESDAAKRRAIADKNRYAQQNAAARGSSRVENQDGRAAYRQVAADRERRAAALDAAQKLADFAQFLIAWRAAQNPIRLTITGSACSGTVSYEVHAYPEHEYEYEIPLEGLVQAGRWISRAMTVVRSVGQLANIQVENSLTCPKDDVKITLKFEWKEGEDEDVYRMVREASVNVTGTLLEWKFEVSVPLTNFLAIIPVLGGLAARAIGWIIQRTGSEATIGIAVEVTLTAEATLMFKWTKARGWEWGEASIRLPIDFKFYLFVRIRIRDWMHMEGRAIVQADPALKLEGSPAGLVLKSDKFEIKVGFTGMIHIDVWFYSFEQEGEWFPESWTCKVEEVDLWTIIGN